MARPTPRARAHRPSPLVQVVHAGHQPPQAEDIRGEPDQVFWNRFSVAMTASQELDEEKSVSSAASGSLGVSVEKSKNDWLQRQHRKKRRCRIIGWSVALSVALAIIAIAVVAWYFTAGPGKAKDAGKRDN